MVRNNKNCKRVSRDQKEYSGEICSVREPETTFTNRSFKVF